MEFVSPYNCTIHLQCLLELYQMSRYLSPLHLQSEYHGNPQTRKTGMASFSATPSSMSAYDPWVIIHPPLPQKVLVWDPFLWTLFQFLMLGRGSRTTLTLLLPFYHWIEKKWQLKDLRSIMSIEWWFTMRLHRAGVTGVLLWLCKLWLRVNNLWLLIS